MMCRLVVALLAIGLAAGSRPVRAQELPAASEAAW